MILVTVGTTEHQFNRMNEVVKKVSVRFPSEIVVFQYGSNRKMHFGKKNIRLHKVLSYEKMSHLIKTARVVITHGGMTTIQTLLSSKKPIVFPRQHKFHEHVNDHQFEFIKTLGRRGLVTVINDPSEIDGIDLNKNSVASNHIHTQKRRSNLISWLDQAVRSKIGDASRPRK